LDSIRNAAFKDAKLTAPNLRERLKSTVKPEDTRSFYEKMAPEFMGGKAASTSGVPPLPAGFTPVK